MAVAFHPAFVEHVAHAAGIGGKHYFLHLLAVGSGKGHESLGAHTVVEDGQRVGVGRELLAVNGCDGRAGLHLGVYTVKGTLLEHLGHTQAVACIGHVVEQTERSGRFVGSAGTIAAAGVAHVELAEKLAGKLGEIIVVIDVGEELAVVLAETLPVGAKHVLDQKTFLLLVENVVIHILALFGQVDFL